MATIRSRSTPYSARNQFTNGIQKSSSTPTSDSQGPTTTGRSPEAIRAASRLARA